MAVVKSMRQKTNVANNTVTNLYLHDGRAGIKPNPTPKTTLAEEKKTVKIRNTEKWLNEYNISYTYKKFNNFDMYYLNVCPFSAEHTGDRCFVQVFKGRNVFFKCHHNHCQRYTIHDMIKKYPVNQLPIITGTKETTLLFNAVADKCDLLLNDIGERYVKYKDKVLPFESSDFNSVLYEIAQEENQLCSATSINTVKDNIRGRFSQFGRKCFIGTRIIQNQHGLFYALSPKQIIAINNGKIKKYTGDTYLFVESPDSKTQVSPDMNINSTQLPGLIKKTFNIEETDLLKFLAQLICFYIPNINTPILVLSGSHGTSKTTTAKKIKSLVDPCYVDVVSIPDKEDGLASVLSNSYLTVFDNAERISTRFSDLLAIACTRGYTSKRKLYSDNELIQIPLHSKILINGIGDLISRPDLAERCNTIYLGQIKERKTEEQVWKEFDELKPKILGAIFNTLLKGLPLVSQMNEKYSDRLPRMADFCTYGAAFIKAMGLDDNSFVNQYTQSCDSSVQECNECDDFIILLKSFLENIPLSFWEGQAQQLLKELKEFACANKLSIDKAFSASSLSRKLQQNSVALLSVGITFERKKSSSRSIILKMESKEQTTVLKSSENVGNVDISNSFSDNHIEDLEVDW